MHTKTMIIEITAIVSLIILPFFVLALSYWGKQLEKSGRSQNTFTKIGMIFFEVLQILLAFVVKALSFLMTGEWSSVSELLSEEEADDADRNLNLRK